ncbi:MAG: tetratricopeptide repeat protein [Candidatus Eisenbacteria bacterium]|nr:tetratricopeptide repeat protein [Candidatus Eisenbacteria bacterium]
MTLASVTRAFAAAALLLLAPLVVTGCSHLVILRDPLSANEHNDLGVAYERGGQPALAAVQYRRSLRLDPRQPRVWVNLGNAEAAQGKWRSAAKSYERAHHDAPEDPDAMNNLAVALLRTPSGRHRAHALALRAVSIGGERDSVYRSTLDEVDHAR